MLRLGTKVRHHGRDAMVIARTLGGHPSYDLRLADGTIVKYASEADCEVPPFDGGIGAPVLAGGQPPQRPPAG
ncbi:hypothetical protein [Roseomonas genomospecies 6]|uniref:Uncharacterized protein n=1 Tax=Roseomonas genomospecies 6 TaxID=214106 RepID=A0A9W7NP52_9PROT|nr:hypothetical protein [Roseomonas genomospecies 6]KAA0684302.1 hypothetical protein DS843_02410 [Roseomonas genomospecies 6]